MADWDDLRVAASKGGLIWWPVTLTEGDDPVIDLDAQVRDLNGEAFDWTTCTEVRARIYEPGSDVTVADLTWASTAAGILRFEASRADLDAAAGAHRTYPNGRDLAWACKVTIPGGHHVQIVAESPCNIEHQGVL